MLEFYFQNTKSLEEYLAGNPSISDGKITACILPAEMTAH
jgi:hypothetical protein